MVRSRPLLTATIGFAVLYVAATGALGSPPEPDTDGASLVGWFRDHGDRVRMWAWLLTVSTPFYVSFVALVRARLPSVLGDIFFFGALALSAETAVMVWLYAGMAWHADQLQPATARVLFDVASHWGPILTSTTMTILASIVVATVQRAPAVPRWIGYFAGVAFVEQVLETLTVFGKGPVLAPGGVMNTVVGAGLFGAFLICLGISMDVRGKAGAAKASP